MSDIMEAKLTMPLDEGFLRRECPYCALEFKVLVTEKELLTVEQKGLESFLVDEPEQPDEDTERTELHCPYCGQTAPQDAWWTKEQLAYATVVAKNIMAQIVNEQFIQPMNRQYGGSSSDLVSFSFKGQEMELEDPWISPETADMEVFDLPCCNRKLKLDEAWHKPVHCLYCGFLHAP